MGRFCWDVFRHFIVHPRRDPWDGWDDPGPTMGWLRIISINVPTKVQPCAITGTNGARASITFV